MAALNVQTLNFTTNTVTKVPAQMLGGLGMMVVYGTMGGATVKLQLSPDGGTTKLDVSATDATFTANGYTALNLPGGVDYYVDCAGGTAHDIDVQIIGKS